MAVAFDATSKTTYSGPSTSISWTHTPVGTPAAIFVTISWTTSPIGVVSAITYGGQAMTLVTGATADGSNFAGAGWTGRTQTYVKTGPLSGPQTVAITLSVAAWGVAGATSFTGVDSAAPAGTVVTATGNSTAPSATIGSSTAGNLVYGAFVHDYPVGTVTEGKTLAWKDKSSNGFGGGAEYTPAGGSKTMDWTMGGGANPWGALAFEILAAAPAGHPTAKRAGGVPFMHKIGGANHGTGRMAW